MDTRQPAFVLPLFSAVGDLLKGASVCSPLALGLNDLIYMFSLTHSLSFSVPHYSLSPPPSSLSCALPLFPSLSQESDCQESEGHSASGAERPGLEAVWESPP